MNTDDPKFTAHILGELNELTSAERAEIEALIRADASAAADAAETQAVAALLRRELHGEEAQPLTPAQRAAVLAAAAPGAHEERAKVVPFPRRLTVLSAIAACLIVGVSIALIHRAMEADKNARPRSLARSDAQSGPTVTLVATAESPAEPPPAPQLAAVTRAEENAASGLDFTKSNDLLAQVPQPAERWIPVPQNATPPAALARAATPQPMTDGERKRTAGFQPDRTHTGRTADTGGYAQTKPSQPLPAAAPATITAGIRGDSPSLNRPTAFSADRSDGLRDDRRRDKGRTEKPADEFRQREPANTDAFDAITDNAFLAVRENPLSTFGTDVDTASYAIIRRSLNERQLPPKGAVRIEELLNYFTYDYPQPKGDAAFSATMEVASCPWTPAHRLVRIGLKGRESAQDKLAVIAKDVKIQVEFNPAQVSAHRLIGYETQRSARENFPADKKGAVEIAAGHTVTALYEVVPAGKDAPKAAALKYQTPAAPKTATAKELMTLNLRYKAPDGDASKLLEFPLTDAGATWEKSSRDFRFTAAVAGCGMLLRDSPHKGAATWSAIHELAVEGKGADAAGYRAEFISLLEKAGALQR